MAEVRQIDIEELYKKLKIEVIEELQDYNILKKDIFNLENKIKTFENKLCMGQAINYGEKVQTSGNGYENAIDNIINTKNEIENKLLKKKTILIVIDKTLSELEEESRELLTFRYIKGWTMNKLQTKYYVDRTTLYRKVQKALAQYIYCKNGIYIERYKKDCRKIDFDC